MPKVLVLYYPNCGGTESTAQIIAEAVRSIGATVDIRRAPKMVPPEMDKTSHFKLDQTALSARTDNLADYDAIIVGPRLDRFSSSDGKLSRSGWRSFYAAAERLDENC